MSYIGRIGIGVSSENASFVSVDDGSVVGDSGPEIEEAPGIVVVAVDRPWNLSAWSDKTHVATNDTEKLWEFVEFCAAEKAADRSDSRVARCGGRRADPVGIDDHRPEFEEGEVLVMSTNASAPIESRSSAGRTHNASDDQHWSAENRKAEHAGDEIKRSLAAVHQDFSAIMYSTLWFERPAPME